MIIKLFFITAQGSSSGPVGKETVKSPADSACMKRFSKTQCVVDCWNPWIQPRWVSWRRPPLFSSSCVRCWPSCRALLSGREWVCRTVHPSQTAEPRWPCGGTERTRLAAKQSLRTERSTRPDGHPRRSHQRHWPPKRGESLSKIPRTLARSKFYILYYTLQCF